MISSFDSKNEAASGVFNCTTASTFEKLNSLKFELLFGEYRRKVEKEEGDSGLVNVVDYMFEPGQIFGFAYQSTGVDFRKMHHVFVLRACEPGEIGNIITGISPGAEILTKILTHAGSQVFMHMLDKLRNGGVDLSQISAGKYRYINDLLEMKIRCDFFVYKLIADNQNSY
jgi:hypothetical protein